MLYFLTGMVIVCVCVCVYTHTRSVTQSCATLCDPVDCSPLGSSVHGISQARILEWVVVSSSRGSSRPETEPISQADSLPLAPPGNSHAFIKLYMYLLSILLYALRPK